MVDAGLGEHSVVLDLRLPEEGAKNRDLSKVQKIGQIFSLFNCLLPQGWCIVGDDDELSLALPKALEGLLVSEHVLARLHDKGETGVDGLDGLLGLLCSHHLGYL